MIIESRRLTIRPFEKSDDGRALRRVFGQDFGDSTGENGIVDAQLENLQSWLEWERLNDEWFPKMLQPPYGDRAITLKSDRRLIGQGVCAVRRTFWANTRTQSCRLRRVYSRAGLVLCGQPRTSETRICDRSSTSNDRLCVQTSACRESGRDDRILEYCVADGNAEAWNDDHAKPDIPTLLATNSRGLAKPNRINTMNI